MVQKTQKCLLRTSHPHCHRVQLSTSATGSWPAVACPRLEDLVVLELPLGDLYEDHWSVTGQQVPDASSPDDAVYLPGRNALLTIKAALWCRLQGIDRLALAVLGSNPFSDATPEFFDDFQSALDRALGGPVRLVRPFARLEKRQVM